MPKGKAPRKRPKRITLLKDFKGRGQSFVRGKPRNIGGQLSATAMRAINALRNKSGMTEKQKRMAARLIGQADGETSGDFFMKNLLKELKDLKK